MTPEWRYLEVILAGMLLSAPALAQSDAATGTGEPDDNPENREEALAPGMNREVVDPGIEEFRVPFRELVEQTLASTSRPVKFDWRSSTIGVGLFASQLSELNNFRSGRAGVVTRFPFAGLLGEVGLSYVWTQSTRSSNVLSLTPFRQAGRPSRFELDLNLSVPLAEGIVTFWPSFVPEMEMVFSATGGIRYLYYAGAQSGFRFTDRMRALFSPNLNDRELLNLDDQRNPGMAIDRSRFSALVGFSTDFYFSNGVFFTPRILMGLPLGGGAPASQVDPRSAGLGVWWEMTIAAGYTFE